MLQAVIFDFDGVICDSEALHYKALNTVFNRYGVDVPKAEHWAKYLGFSDRENIEAVSRDYGMGLDAAGIERLMNEKKALFEEIARKETMVIDGVETFIGRLIKAGVRCAICSGALRSDINLMLAGTHFANVFEVVVAAEDVQHGKPDPEGYLRVLERLNHKRGPDIRPSDCVVIEDSHWGLEAAVAAGMHPIAVTTTYGRDELDGKAKKIVDRIDELTVRDLEEICNS